MVRFLYITQQHSKKLPDTPQSKKPCRRMDECDKLLVQSLKDIQERSHQRQAQRDDMDTNFCLEVAGRLKRLAPKENAFVKLKIQQLLFEVEFANNASV